MASGSTTKRRVKVSADNDGRRLDNLLLTDSGLPRPALYRLIRLGAVRVNDKKVAPSYRLQADDEVSLPENMTAPRTAEHKPVEQASGRAPHTGLIELGRGQDYLVADKPAGLASQGGTGILDSVASMMDAAFADMPRLRLVHRLDRETSGCLVLAASVTFARAFQLQLKNREVHKEYLCLVQGAWDNRLRTLQGELPSDGPVHHRARGQQAATGLELLWRDEHCSLLLARPLTGRTHQLRIQLSAAGHPLLGDKRYGESQKGSRLCLHAHRISFLNVRGRRCTYTSPVPPALATVFRRRGVDSSAFRG